MGSGADGMASGGDDGSVNSGPCDNGPGDSGPVGNGPEDDGGSLGRTERRLLRRLYNGRSIPIIADGRPFLTYKEASRYLKALDAQSREAAYAQMKAQAG